MSAKAHGRSPERQRKLIGCSRKPSRMVVSKAMVEPSRYFGHTQTARRSTRKYGGGGT